MSVGCERHRIQLGAYALDALDASERAGFDAHLAGCPACRAELAELREVADLLALVKGTDLPAADDVRPLRGRRSARRALAAAAAIVVLAGGAVGAFSLAGGDGAREPAAVSASATDRATRVSAHVVLRPRAWGTAALLHLRGVRPHQVCRLLVVARDGTRETAATWRANYEGAADVPGATAIRLRDIASLQVIAERDGRLVAIRL